MRFASLIAILVLAGTAAASPFQDGATPPDTKAEKKAGDLPVGKKGPGMVWADPETKTYYRSDHPLYGKTKKGTYMSEGDALNGGFHNSTQNAPNKPGNSSQK